jgi:hypothetical protein
MTERTASRSCARDEHSRCRGRTHYFGERPVEDGRLFSLGAAGSTWQVEQRYRVYSLPSARKVTRCGLPAPQTSHLVDREMVKCMVRPISAAYLSHASRASIAVDVRPLDGEVMTSIYGWHTIDSGDAGDAEPEPWEPTSEDPEQLEKAQPQRDRRARERTRSR